MSRDQKSTGAKSLYDQEKEKKDLLAAQKIEFLRQKNFQKKRLTFLECIYNTMIHHIKCLDETQSLIIENKDYSQIPSLATNFGNNSVQYNDTSLSRQTTINADDLTCNVSSPEGRQDQVFSCSSENSISDGGHSSPSPQKESINQQDLNGIKQKVEDISFNEKCRLKNIEKWLLHEKQTDPQVRRTWSLGDLESVCGEDWQADHECVYEDPRFIDTIDTVETRQTNQNISNSTGKKGQLTTISAEEKNPNYSHLCYSHAITDVNDNNGLEGDIDFLAESSCYGTSPEKRLDEIVGYNSEDSTSSDSDKLFNSTQIQQPNQNGFLTNTNHMTNTKESLENKNYLQMFDTLQGNYKNQQQTGEHYSHGDLKRSFSSSISKHKRGGGLNHAEKFTSYYCDRQPRKMQRLQNCTRPHTSKVGANCDLDGNVVADERTKTTPETCSVSDSFVLNDKDGENISKARNGPFTKSEIIEGDQKIESNSERKSLANIENSDGEKSNTANLAVKESATTLNMNMKECQSTSSSTVEEDQGTSNITVEERRITSRSTVEEDQITASSTVEESQITTSSTVEESQITAGSKVEESQITTSSTVEESQITASSTVEEDQITAGSKVEESQITASSTVEESQITASSTVAENQTISGSTVQESQITAGNTVGESQITVCSTDGKDKITAGNTVGESQITVCSTDGKDKITAGSTVEESQITASSTVEITRLELAVKWRKARLQLAVQWRKVRLQLAVQWRKVRLQIAVQWRKVILQHAI